MLGAKSLVSESSCGSRVSGVCGHRRGRWGLGWRYRWGGLLGGGARGGGGGGGRECCGCEDEFVLGVVALLTRGETKGSGRRKGRERGLDGVVFR